MKKDNKTIGLMLGPGNKLTQDVCRSLAKEGISAIVKQTRPDSLDKTPASEVTEQWSGRPGEDLFFNGWKLLF